MSLNQAIKHGKEKRKPYIGAKAIDCTCRNHGSCAYCKENRLHQSNKMISKTNQELKQYQKGNINESDD